MKHIKDAFLTIRMTSKMRGDIEEIALENECSVSSVVRYALDNLTK